MKITQLLKYIADLNPQNTPARLSLYNYLRHFIFEKDEVNATTINSFFSQALEYPHWVSNKTLLGKEVQYLLENFYRAHKSEFDFSQIHFPHHLQIVEIESFADLTRVTERYARSILSQDDRYRLIPDQGRRLLLVLLKADHSVEVSVIDKKFVIRNGQLEPLRPDLKITYDSKLDLKANTIQTLEVAPYLLAQFRMVEGQPQGALLRGYVFQKFHEFQKVPLEEQTKLFVPLKRMEQMFIDKQSDPYYLDLIAQLSEGPNQRHEGDLANENAFRRTLERGELALREIFIGDKTLAGLISEGHQLLKPSVSKEPALWPNPISPG